MTKQHIDSILQEANDPVLAVRQGVVDCANRAALERFGDRTVGKPLVAVLGFALPCSEEPEGVRGVVRSYAEDYFVRFVCKGEWCTVTHLPLPAPVSVDSALPNLMDNLSAEMRRNLSVMIPCLDSIERAINGTDAAMFADKVLQADAERNMSEARRGGFALMDMCDILAQTAADLRGTARRSLHTVNLTELITEACARANAVCETGGVGIRTVLPEDTLFLTADKDRLEAVFYDLLSFAVTDSAEGREVTVTAAEMDGEVSLSLCGFAKQDEEPDFAKMFLRYRLGPPCDGRGNLGIPLVSSLAETHKGRLCLFREGGKNTVTLMLPRQQHPGVGEMRENRVEYKTSYPRPLVKLSKIPLQSPLYLKKNFPKT